MKSLMRMLKEIDRESRSGPKTEYATGETPWPSKTGNGAARIDFKTEPARYRHWKLTVDGEIATWPGCR